MTTTTKPRRTTKKQPKAARPLPEILQDIRDAHRACQDYMSARTRLHLQMLSICRRHVRSGVTGDLDEKQRAKLNADAQEMLTKAKEGHYPALSIVFSPMFQAFDLLRKVEEGHAKDLAKLARELPIAPWVDSICGLGDVSVARIVAELGDPGNYSNPAKCWKRLGLAVMNGHRQGHVPNDGTLTADERSAVYVTHGYSPKRRSIVYVAVESLLRRQNVYKECYDARKLIEAPRAERPMIAHRRAQRYASKRLIKDLWRQWRLALGQPCPEPQVEAQ